MGDINALQAEITDIQSYIGYTDADIYGVEVDFKNKKFTRLAGAVGKTPGDAFVVSRLLVEEKDAMSLMKERLLHILVSRIFRNWCPDFCNHKG